jgi:phosphoglycolate phosphatase-like HAD superfamily hydrolase
MAIIALDLDGTLLTCEPRQSTVLRAACVRNGASIGLAEVWQLKRSGKSTLDAMQTLGMPAPSASRISSDWMAMIEQPQWLALDSVLPGVRQWMDAVKGSGGKLQLITARRRPEFLRPQLRNLGLESLFSWIHCVSEGSISKAKANCLQLTGAQLFIGDTESDALAARTAGISFAAVTTGQRSEKFLREVVGERIHTSLANVDW